MSLFLFGAAIFCFSLLPTQAYGLAGQNSLGRTPQMGWNTWNTFKQEYNVSVIEETTELFHTLGLKDAGYNYILLDEGWSDDARTADGFLQANKSTFPDGMKELSSYIHSHGLKMGLYGDSGILTCGFKPGSWGYEERDAWTLADWDIDYWKYDNCGGFQAMTIAPQVRFSTMQNALFRTGKDIFYSVCEWGYQFPWHWGGEIGHSYRMSGDITYQFTNETGCECKTAYCLNTGYAGCSVTSIIRKMREISKYQKPGHWADMDMLEVGNGDMTINMQQTHFAFWAALKSPLIIGADISTLKEESLAVLKNKDIIALNQDPLGVAVDFVEKASIEGSLQVWAGPLSDGNVVLVFNEKSYPQKATVRFDTLGLDLKGKPHVKELWANKSCGKNMQVSVELEAYQTVVYKLT